MAGKAGRAVRERLRADCGECFGLCCVALAFSRSADFAADKKAGEACRNLDRAHRCGIHAGLRGSGYKGCTVYDCFGAGQHLSQVTFGGQDWRAAADGGRAMFAALPLLRQLHELLWYLGEARDHGVAREETERAWHRVDTLTRLAPAELAAVDPAAERAAVGELLLRVSETVRARVPGRRADHRGADLVGARLRGAALRGAGLRGALLIGADLRAADLRLADLLGADLRDTDLRGADLTGALFLTQSQLNAARGDTRTVFPPALDRPAHWA
ncbi:pentapeptide repeat-containing protein [Streptomyces sp. ITFR-21]|nr:pentapeptide repeat-containing protein [Streptomyces sp. ITFR-21]WNI15674.1 pentapeptide repeat-containing protein [Streptomyces sp. ITFR-21]